MQSANKNSGHSAAGQAGESQQPRPSKNKRHPRRRYVGAADVSAVLDRQHRLCALTGWPLTPSVAGADYVTPLCRGGKPAPENLQVLHIDVRSAKGQCTNEEFVRLCRAVVAVADARQAGSATS